MPSSSPAPKPTANFFTSALLLFGGSFGGTHLTALVAPYSQWSGVVGFLMFPIAFMTGMQMWPWIDRRVERIRSIPNRVRKIKPIASRRSKGVIGPWSFVITSIATSILSGLILTPPAMQIVVDPGYRVLITAGAIYGIICWILIQLGYLQQANVYPKDS
ncbi:hypothetical protein Lepto7375DRAFT_6044 [Leptolyngbya sp. PCC 7375]|nr:hypothetical protein Lepto7375DRAFT_6044 [Leptolyngbya sp. PCC 7375]